MVIKVPSTLHFVIDYTNTNSRNNIVAGTNTYGGKNGINGRGEYGRRVSVCLPNQNLKNPLAILKNDLQNIQTLRPANPYQIHTRITKLKKD